MRRKLKILFVSAEVHPFAKTGGLADVSGALPPALKLLGHDIRVVTPKYFSTSKVGKKCDQSGCGINCSRLQTKRHPIPVRAT